MLNVDTTDIYPFRFMFWQPLKLFYKLLFRNICWIKVRFIGVAWETRYQFAFKIWSEPDGDWSKGKEYTHIFISPRH